MITEFIGQGINDETDESAGNHICSSINNDVFTGMNFFVAFMRSKGLREMKPFIKKATLPMMTTAKTDLIKCHLNSSKWSRNDISL